MSWQQQQPDKVVTTEFLEERINMYISAMDTASAVNDGHQSLQLQRDIQKLVDLMERVGSGEEIMQSQVPPPLVITPQTDVLPNAPGELSSRLADYHKALYFAEEELSDDRMNKIQKLQRALQVIHSLQKRAEAGFHIRVDEIPPPVTIPSDDEFDNDAVNTLSSRIAQYQEALKAAEQSKGTDRRRITKIQRSLRTLEFLMTRAKAKRPVWKRDIPPEFEYYNVEQKSSPSLNGTKYLLKIKSLLLLLSAPSIAESNIGDSVADAHKKLSSLQEELETNKEAQPWLRSGNSPTELTQMVEKLEKLAAKKKENGSGASQNLTLVDARIHEYTTAAVRANKEKQTRAVLKNMKVLKGLQSLKKSLEKGETVDMTLVPPPPRDYTPTGDSPPSVSQTDSSSRCASAAPQSETARLLPVNVRSTVETAEDKLALKLSNYLDTGDDSLEVTERAGLSNMNIYDTGASKSASRLLKKVQNATVQLPAEKILYGDPGFSDSLASIDQNGEDGENEAGKGENHKDVMIKKEVDAESEVDSEEIRDATEEKNMTRDSKKNAMLSQESDTVLSKENNLERKSTLVETDDQRTKHVSPESTPKSSPKSSGDVYLRKTLNNVGFLSCQPVPLVTNKVKSEELSSLEATKQEHLVNSTASGHIIVQAAIQPQECQSSEGETDSSLAFASSGHSYTSPINTSSDLPSGEATDMSTGPDLEVNQRTCVVVTSVEERPTSPIGASANSLLSKSDFRASDIPQDDVRNNSSNSNTAHKMTENIDIPSSAVKQDYTVAPVSKAIAFEDRPIVARVLEGSNTGHNGTPGITRSELETSSSCAPQRGEGAVLENRLLNHGNEELEFKDLMDSMSMPPAQSKSGVIKLKPPTNSLDAPVSLTHLVSSHESNFSFLPEEQIIGHSFQNISHLHGTATSPSVVEPHHFHPSSVQHNGNSLSASSVVVDPYSEQHFLDSSRSLDADVNCKAGSSLMSNGTICKNAAHTGVVFTCLENLKYDLLVEKSKNKGASTEEVTKLEMRMEQIKAKLRQSGRLIWELYKTCIESELASLTKEIVALQRFSQNDYVRALQHKQRLANRELKLLQERLPKLSY